MSIYKKVFTQTAIYGLAAVIPRVIGFFLTPLHTTYMNNSTYGEYTVVFSIIMFLNVVLAFGMETAFFRFYTKQENKKEVINNTMLFLMMTSITFLLLSLSFSDYWASFFDVPKEVLNYVIWILVLDALVVIPFAKLRADQRPIVYAVIRIGNVVINTFLSFFFLAFLPLLSVEFPGSWFDNIYIENFQVSYLFIANLIASLLTFLVFTKLYWKINWRFNRQLNKEMVRYGFPVMISGLAFAINESFDKILLKQLLPADIALEEVGKYAACYKLGLFMVLFRQAYTLGIEPFFFNYAKHSDAPIKYATITKYFVIIGSLIMFGVILFSDILKLLFIRNESFWDAMVIVPLIILANFCMGIYTNLSVWYKLRDKTIWGAYISIIGAVLTLVLNFLLIPKFSYLGSAIATLIAYGAMMTISYFLGQKYYPIPYDKKAILSYLGISITLSGIYFYNFREQYIIGFSMFALFTIYTLYQERTLLSSVLKK